jgi:hypothetical protein
MNLSFLRGVKANINLLDAADVEANRRSQITPAQDKRLNSMAMGNKGFSALFLPLIFLAIFFFILFGTLMDGSSFGWFMLIPLLFIVFFSLGLVKALYGWWQNSARLKVDRANNVIRSLIGELTFDRKKGYIFQAQGDQVLVIPPSNNLGGLLPGVRYNVFYLPESGFILSAERAGETSQALIRVALSNILAQTNNFTLEDLQANQMGEITGSQRKRGASKIISGLVIIAFSLAFAIIFFLPFITGNGSSINDGVILIIIGGFIAIFGSIGAWMVLNAILDLTATTPEMVEGMGHKVSRRKSSGRSSRTVYYYVIGQSEFEVPKKAFDAFIENIEYRVYFTPRTKTLISIEPTNIPQV